jgi:hypothetical protein
MSAGSPSGSRSPDRAAGPYTACKGSAAYGFLQHPTPARTSWSAIVASDVPIDGGTTDAQGLGDRRHRVLPGAIHLLGHLQLVPAQHRRPTTVAAASPRGGQPGAGTFADQVAFELGQGSEDMEHELAPGVVVSIASWRLQNPTPRSARPVTVSTRCRRERPNRSSFQTTRVSPGRSWSRSCSRTGRSVRAPLAVSAGASPIASPSWAPDRLWGVPLQSALGSSNNLSPERRCVTTGSSQIPG